MEKPAQITADMLAPASRRFANYIIDSTICYILALGTGQLGNIIYDNYGYDGLATGKPDITNLKFSLLHTVLTIMYYGLTETLLQRSIAKYITGTKVVMRDGSKPGNNTILLRTLCRLIPFEIISFMGRFAIGWHDTLSKTVVVRTWYFDKGLNEKDGAEAIEQEEETNN